MVPEMLATFGSYKFVSPEKFSSRESYLYHSQVEHFREAFNLFDTDGGGSIDIDELGACLRSLGKVRHRQDNLGRSD